MMRKRQFEHDTSRMRPASWEHMRMSPLLMIEQSGDLWVQRFPSKGKSLPAEKYVPSATSAAATAAPATPAMKPEDIDSKPF
jgi:hypothetical protein